MNYEELTDIEPPIYTLIPVDEFKSVLGIDDRDDKIVKFSLATSTLTIENYCKRKLLHKKHFERIEYIGSLTFPLKEYPITEILAVSLYDNGEILEPDLYCVIPDCGIDNDIPFILSFSPAVGRFNFSAIKAIYYSGYEKDAVPSDLQAYPCADFAHATLSRWGFNWNTTVQFPYSHSCWFVWFVVEFLILYSKNNFPKRRRFLKNPRYNAVIFQQQTGIAFQN